MTKNKKLDELCYPFIHEQGCLCDFEVISDELCSQVGMCLALLDGDQADLAADLAHLQPLCWHVNGSVRGKLAIVEDDMNWLHHRYDHYREEIDGMRQGFVLPRSFDHAVSSCAFLSKENHSRLGSTGRTRR